MIVIPVEQRRCTVAMNPRKEPKVSFTEDGSYRQLTMQLAHFGFPESVPYFSQSVSSINSLKVEA